MYFTTTANGKSETTAIGDTFTEPILMKYIYDRGERYSCLLRYVLYTKHIIHCVQLQK